MSNSHLFLQARNPKAALQNGVGRYVVQLQRLTIKFCKTSAGSKGARNFIAHNLLDFAKENPGVVTYVKPRRHRAAVLVAEYLNGDRHWLNINNNSDIEVQKWIGLLRTQNGNTSAFRLKKLFGTKHPSIQGSWTPFTHKDPALNLATFPDPSLSKPIDTKKSATELLIELYAKQNLEDHPENSNIVVEDCEDEKKN